MEEKRVMCIGVNPAFDVTLVVDGLDHDRVNRVISESKEAAGKAANVACVLSKKGIDTILTGCYGADTWQEWHALYSGRSDRVEHLPVLISGSTRQNITLLVGGETVKINRVGDEIDPSGIIRLREIIDSCLRPNDVAVFSGSLIPGMSKGQYLSLMEQAAKTGARVVVDTDRLTEAELLSVKPWLYKPNAHELAKLCGADHYDDESLIAHAKRLVQQGIEIVLLTLGERGLAVITCTKTMRVFPERIKAINTVGAGDAALAVFIESFLNEKKLDECARAAARAGERVAADQR